MSSVNLNQAGALKVRMVRNSVFGPTKLVVGDSDACDRAVQD